MNSLSYFNGNSVNLSNTNLLLLCICNLRWHWGLYSAVYSSSTQHCSLLLLMEFPTSVINIFQYISLILCFVKVLLCNATTNIVPVPCLPYHLKIHLPSSHLSFTLLCCNAYKNLETSDCKWAENIASHAKLYILFVSLSPSASDNLLPPCRS